MGAATEDLVDPFLKSEGYTKLTNAGKEAYLSMILPDIKMYGKAMAVGNDSTAREIYFKLTQATMIPTHQRKFFEEVIRSTK